MSRNFIGEFEELVLTIVAILGEESYGGRIVEEIEDKVNRKVSLSAVHITLYRLEDKGLLKSEMGKPSGTRGGRRKRIFTISNAGVSMLKELNNQRKRLFKLIPQFNLSLL